MISDHLIGSSVQAVATGVSYFVFRSMTPTGSWAAHTLVVIGRNQAQRGLLVLFEAFRPAILTVAVASLIGIAVNKVVTPWIQKREISFKALAPSMALVAVISSVVILTFDAYSTLFDLAEQYPY